MANGRLRLEWQQTSMIVTTLININRDPKRSRALAPDALVPPSLRMGGRRKHEGKITGRAAWDMLRAQIVRDKRCAQ